MVTNVSSPAAWTLGRSTVSTLSRLIKTGVGGLSGPACLPQSDQVAIAYLQSVPKVRDNSTRNQGPGWASLHCRQQAPEARGVYGHLMEGADAAAAKAI